MSTNNNKGLGIATTKAAATNPTINNSRVNFISKEDVTMKTVAQNNNNVNINADNIMANSRHNVKLMSIESLREIHIQELVSTGISEKDAARVVDALCTYKVVNMSDIDNLPLSVELKAYAKSKFYIPVDKEDGQDKRPVNINLPVNDRKRYMAELCRVFTREEARKIANYRSTRSGKDFAQKRINNVYALVQAAGITYERVNTLIMAGKLTAGGANGKMPVNVNVATIEELAAFDGIGANYAARIMMAVAKKPVTSVEELVDRKVITKSVLDKVMATEGWALVAGEGTKAETLKDIVTGILKGGNHKSPNGLIRDMKRRGGKGKSTILCRKLVFKFKNNVAGKIVAIPTVTSMPLSMVNENYVDDVDREFTLSNGYQYPTGGRLNSDTILCVNFSAGRGNEDAEATMALLKKSDIIVVRSKAGKDMYLVEIGSKLISLNELVTDYDEDGNKVQRFKEYASSAIRNEDGSYKENVILVANHEAGAIYSTSQGRKDEILFFSCRDEAEVKKYEDMMNYATFGEFDVRKNGEHGKNVTDTVLIDALTRLSSHTTGMGSTLKLGACLDSITILFGKDDNIDGIGYMRASAAGRVACQVTGASVEDLGGKYGARILGSQLQIRPVTCKATAHIASDDYCDAYESGKNILVIKAYRKIAKKTIQQLERKLIKGAKGDTSMLDKYDGVRLVYSKNADHDRGDIIAECNFVKDAWAFNRKTGLNVLLVAHFDGRYNDIYTSGQMFKIFAALAKKNGPEAVAKFNEICKSLVDNAVKQATDWEEIASRGNNNIGFEEVDTSYTAGLFRNLKKDELFRYPFLMRGVIDDAAKTLSRYAQLNRYPICGHTGMFNIDPLYVLAYMGLSQDEIIELAKIGKLGVIRQGNGYMEVYDPVANAFYDSIGAKDDERIGFLLKYPCMGTRETGIIRYPSDDVIAERLCALAEDGISEEIILLAAVEFANLKEGSVFLPIYLDGIGRIWAGSDRDGDKGTFVFHVPGKQDLTWFLIKYGFESIAVNIGKPSDGNVKTRDITNSAFNDGFVVTSLLQNEKVGPITNSFTKLILPLMKEFSEVERAIYTDVFNDVFEVGSALENGEAPVSYTSAITYTKDEFSNDMAETKGDAMTILYDTLKKMAPFDGSDESWAELMTVVNDLPVLARHCQELVIDAAKKFYKVNTAFVAELSRKMTLTNMKFKCEISADWSGKNPNPVYALHTGIMPENIDHALIGDVAYTMENWDEMDAVISQEPVILISKYKNKNSEHRVQYVLPDFMAAMRKYAVEESVKALNAMVADYHVANEAYSEVRLELNTRGAAASLNINNDSALKAFDTLLQQTRTAVRTYHLRKEALNLEYDFESLSETEIVDVDMTISKTLHMEFDAIMANLDNMFRIVRETYNVSVEDMMAYIFSKEDTENVFAGKVLKAETAYVILKNEIASEAIRTPMEDKSILEKAVAGGSVKVVDGKVVEAIDLRAFQAGKKFRTALNNVYANVADGSYKSQMVNGVPSVVRPATDFINIPAADHSTIIVPVFTGKSNTAGADAVRELTIGEEVSLEVVKQGKFRKTFINVGGENVTEVYNGYVLPLNGLSGKVKDVITSEEAQYKNTYIVLGDVTKTETKVNAATDNSEIVMPTINPDELESAESILSGF